MEGPLPFLMAHPTGQPFRSGPPKMPDGGFMVHCGPPGDGGRNGEKTPRLLQLLLADRVVGCGEVMVTEGTLAALAQGAAFW